MGWDFEYLGSWWGNSNGCWPCDNNSFFIVPLTSEWKITITYVDVLYLQLFESLCLSWLNCLVRGGSLPVAAKSIGRIETAHFPSIFPINSWETYSRTLTLGIITIHCLCAQSISRFSPSILSFCVASDRKLGALHCAFTLRFARTRPRTSSLE